MWFLIGLLFGLSVTVGPSTGPCSVADLAPPWGPWDTVGVLVCALIAAAVVLPIFFRSGPWAAIAEAHHTAQQHKRQYLAEVEAIERALDGKAVR